MPGIRVLNNLSLSKSSPMICPRLQCDGLALDLSHPRVMGVLNITPDSFSDGGRFYSGQKPDIDKALARARVMVHEGADIIDIGGESTRPGAAPLTPQQELDRVIPVLEAIHKNLQVIISIDTSDPQVMLEAARAGSGMINDVRALQRPGALQAAAQSALPVCLMHMQGEPGTMQNEPEYRNVVEDVQQFLRTRIAACEAAGIKRSRLLIDPGFGFGKSRVHNLHLLNQLDQLKTLGLPVLVGLSRKSMIGQTLGLPVEDRLYGSLALAVLAVERGAHIIRCHDVKATVDAVQMAAAVLEQEANR